MIDVKITDYGSKKPNDNYIKYTVSGLTLEAIDYLDKNLEDKHTISGDNLIITMNFPDKYYPFGSDVAKFRLEDFIAREEIEMMVFLSSFLEDMVNQVND